MPKPVSQFKSSNPFVDRVISLFLPAPGLMGIISGVVAGDQTAILRFRPKRQEDAENVRTKLVSWVRNEGWREGLAVRAQSVEVNGTDNFFLKFQVAKRPKKNHQKPNNTK